MITCGLWLVRRRLVAALVNPDGSIARRAIRAADSDDARWALLDYLEAIGCAIVTTQAVARTDLLPAQAARRGLVVWQADDGAFSAILRAAAIREPARAAAVLARLPAVPSLRAQLRRLVPVNPAAQLPLL